MYSFKIFEIFIFDVLGLKDFELSKSEGKLEKTVEILINLRNQARAERNFDLSDQIRDQLKSFEDAGYGEFPICIAKTQYSFSTDPSLKGAPTGHSLPIREIKLSSGAEFIVVICGAVMTMPGLPRVPAADSIKLNKDGEIEGLF